MRLLDMEQHGAPPSSRVQAGRLTSPQRLTTAPGDNPDPLRSMPTWNGNERTDPQIDCTASASASPRRVLSVGQSAGGTAQPSRRDRTADVKPPDRVRSGE